LSTLTIRLSLPEALSITLTARVVQVIKGAAAETRGGQCALALEVLDLDGERKQQLTQLLSFAAAEHNRDGTSTSFTHHLLEASTSLPPREIGMRLSQLPAPSPARVSRAPSTDAEDPQSESGYRHTATTRSRRDDITRPLSPARARAQQTSAPAGSGSQPQAPVAAAPSPTDPEKLKTLLSNVAHKHYDAALRLADEMLAAAPNQPQVRRWRALCLARIALSRDDTKLAAQAYEAVLEIDPNDREAREYLKAHSRNKRLDSLPFGRFFAKKK
jgi:tetratricopeptide (TPR) repeat protein